MYPVPVSFDIVLSPTLHKFFLFFRDAEDKVRKSMERLLSIWEERGVYSKEFIKQVRQAKGKF